MIVGRVCVHAAVQPRPFEDGRDTKRQQKDSSIHQYSESISLWSIYLIPSTSDYFATLVSFLIFPTLALSAEPHFLDDMTPRGAESRSDCIGKGSIGTRAEFYFRMSESGVLIFFLAVAHCGQYDVIVTALKLPRDTGSDLIFFSTLYPTLAIAAYFAFRPNNIFLQ